MAEETSDLARRLPSGRHRIPRGVVVEHQRQRLIRAVARAVSARGYAAVSVTDICVRAGVSRGTFYENFHDKEDCFIASYRQHLHELLAVVRAAVRASSDAEERAKFGLTALLRCLAEEPDVARMGVVEVMAAGPTAMAEHDRAVTSLAALIGGEDRATASTPTGALLWRTLAGAIEQLVYARVRDERADELEELVPVSVYLVLVALTGPARAASRSGLLPSSAIGA